MEFNAVARKIELRDAALDLAAGGAVNRRALEDDVSAIFEANAEVTRRRLVVGQVEPKRHAGGLDGERMGVVALKAGEFHRINHSVRPPAFLAETIVAGRDAHGIGTGTKRIHYLRHDASARLTLGLLLLP